MENKEDIRKILVINLGGIGDFLLSTPALRAIKARYSQSSLYLLAVDRVADLAGSLAYVDGVFIFELGHPWRKFFSNIKVLFELRRLKLDLAINMRTLTSDSGAAKIRCLLRIISPRIKAGRGTAGRGRFFDLKIPEEEEGDKYEMEYDLEMARALGVDVKDRSIDFAVDDQSLKKADKMLGETGFSGTDILVGIHPGGKPSHRWPLERFAEVMMILAREYNCKFVITGSSDEKILAESLIRRIPGNCADLSGKLGLKELAAVMKKCTLFISNDTGAMHVAAISGVPLVAIFGPGYLKRYDPANISAKAVVVHKKQNCAPCDRSRCVSMNCLKDISVHEVIKAAESLRVFVNRKGEC